MHCYIRKRSLFLFPVRLNRNNLAFSAACFEPHARLLFYVVLYGGVAHGFFLQRAMAARRFFLAELALARPVRVKQDKSCSRPSRWALRYTVVLSFPIVYVFIIFLPLSHFPSGTRKRAAPRGEEPCRRGGSGDGGGGSVYNVLNIHGAFTTSERASAASRKSIAAVTAHARKMILSTPPSPPFFLSLSFLPFTIYLSALLFFVSFSRAIFLHSSPSPSQAHTFPFRSLLDLPLRLPSSLIPRLRHIGPPWASESACLPPNPPFASPAE